MAEEGGENGHEDTDRMLVTKLIGVFIVAFILIQGFEYLRAEFGTELVVGVANLAILAVAIIILGAWVLNYVSGT